MVDGGKPQLERREGPGLARPRARPLVAIAKKEEILFTPASREGIRLDRTSAALRLVQAVRDETTASPSLFTGRREKKSFESILDGISGVGPKKRSALLARYGSLEAIRNAPREELDALVGAAAAARVIERLAGSPEIDQITSLTIQLRARATPMLSPTETNAHRLPISFHRMANVDRHGMKKLMKT